MKKSGLKVRIVGEHLPGISFKGLKHREPVYVGIQNKKDVIELKRGDSREVTFDFNVGVLISRSIDYHGPFVFGTKGKRFLYLSWVELRPDGSYEMFRRAKLHLSVLKSAEVRNALSKGLILEGKLDLTDESGGPLCASVLPPRIRWSFERI